MASFERNQGADFTRNARPTSAEYAIAFRTGAEDASHMAREFSPVFGADDLITLPNYYIYLKLMIDGTPSKPFSAITSV